MFREDCMRNMNFKRHRKFLGRITWKDYGFWKSAEPIRRGQAAVAILMFFGCACLTGALFSGLEMAFAKSEAKSFIERKEFYDDLLANVDENASTETVWKIIDEVKKNNEKILKDRVLDHNIVVGKMYRTEVAELELTPIPEMQIKKINN